MAWDKSTRNDAPREKTFPVIVRTGFLGTSAQKVWDNPGNVPSVGTLLVTNTSGSAVTFNVWVVDDLESPGNEDKVGAAIPLAANETMEFPSKGLMIPSLGELWMSASTGSAVTAYWQAEYYV